MKKSALLFFSTLIMMSFTKERKAMLYAPVRNTIQSLEGEFNQIPEDRKMALKELTLFIEGKVKTGEHAGLIFICTHNSRRSHISQIWAQTAASYYGIRNVQCYSGGTEATAFNPRAVKAMKNVGFEISKSTDGENPVYEIRYSDGFDPIKAYSKKYDADGNPQDNFGAVMTCSHADKSCPIVRGASERISIPYEDPKAFDGTPQETEMYNERVRQIGRDMLYAFSLIKV